MQIFDSTASDRLARELPRRALFPVLVYALFAGLWILLSDEAVGMLTRDPAEMQRISMLKGWFFVGVTSLLLYVLIRRLLGEVLRLAQGKDAESLSNARTKQLLAEILDSSSDAIFAKDREGRYQLFNHEVARVTGVASERVLGCDDRALFPLEQAERIRANDQEVMREGRVVSYEESLTTIEGERTYLAIKGPLHDVDGQVNGTFGISRDITERKKAEEARRKADERYLTVLDNAADPIFIADHAGRYTYVNRRAARLLGYTQEELLSLVIPDITPPEDVAHAQATFRELLANRQVTTELLLRCKDGSTVPVELNAIMLPDGSAFGACRDISERKRTARELELHRNHLEKLVAARTRELSETASKLMDTQFAMNSVGIGIHWVDAENGRFLYVNRVAAEMLGYSIEDMLAMSVPDIDPNFSIGEFRLLSSELRGREHTHFETLNRARDGSLLPVEVSIHYLEPRDGQRARFISFVTDISARKEAELALLQAKDAAETATRSKSAFLANMSHEIRTPMNGILGLAHLMRQENMTPRQAEYLDKIAASGKHLLGVINDILDLSKIEAGKLVLEQRDFRLNEVLDDVLAVTGDIISAKGLHFEMDMAGMPEALRGDPTRITQVLVNFLGNAVKFTERGGITLRGRLLGEDDDGYRIRFEVSDTGVGIAPELQSRLFDNFAQADSSTTRKYGGTGLGLAINRRIAELFQGEVGLESEPGQGSTFWIILRLARSQAVPPAPAAAAEQHAEAVLRRDHEGTRVLVAEDNPINQQVALMLLESCGLSPALAEDGRQALEMARQGDYAAILMDMQMPEMDGIEATRLIRQLPACQDVPILAMTANAFEDDEERCLAAGMNDFIAKPVDPARLYEKLAHWLSRKA